MNGAAGDFDYGIKIQKMEYKNKKQTMRSEVGTWDAKSETIAYKNGKSLDGIAATTVYRVAIVEVYLNLRITSIEPRPSTNQSTSLKSGSLYLLMVSVRMQLSYVQNTPIKELNIFQGSALVCAWTWVIFTTQVLLILIMFYFFLK